jgi:hypothetical protein
MKGSGPIETSISSGACPMALRSLQALPQQKGNHAKPVPHRNIFALSDPSP